MNPTLLSVKGLTISLPTSADRRYAVESLDIEIERGEIVCIVGESGSGKSMAANAIMGLLPPSVWIEAGAISFDGLDLLSLSERAKQTMRGERIAMIFQEPMTALNPLMRIGRQISEVYEVRGLHTPSERKAKVLRLIDEVGLPDPQKIFRAYPFQLSGGQRQRVMIAMALALEPKLLIADEPTTALDVTTQAQILQLIHALKHRHGMGVMFITHDFGVVSDIADRVVVMRHGKAVEAGPIQDVLDNPQDSYTRTLLDAIPKLVLPDADSVPSTPLLEIRGLNKTYVTSGGFLSETRQVTVLDDVNLIVDKGEVLGLVGESGSGKSTLGKSIVRLVRPDCGQILVNGVDILQLSEPVLRKHHKKIQMVFQDPYASLNPRRTIMHSLIAGPMSRGVSRSDAQDRARELLTLVGLSRDAGARFPNEFSGGQRQRIGIARALAMDPDLIVADEAVSALDVSIQAQVLDLLCDLRSRLSLSMIFITHDLRIAAQICDRVAVMQGGRLIEIGPVREIFQSPREEYTRKLLAAVPGQTWLGDGAS